MLINKHTPDQKRLNISELLGERTKDALNISSTSVAHSPLFNFCVKYTIFDGHGLTLNL